jgi:hypothetical protein
MLREGEVASQRGRVLTSSVGYGKGLLVHEHYTNAVNACCVQVSS